MHLYSSKNLSIPQIQKVQSQRKRRRLNFAIRSLSLQKAKSFGYLEIDWFILRKYIDDILGNLELPEPARILDAGCGSGLWTVYISSILENVYMVAIDKDKAALEKAQALCCNLKITSVNFLCVDLRVLSELNNFDLVICFNALHYYDNSEEIKILTRLAEVLRPGGYLLFIGPACEISALGWFRRYQFKKNYVGYTLESIRSKAWQAGFEILTSHYIVGRWGRLAKELSWLAANHKVLKIPINATAYIFLFIDWITGPHKEGNFILALMIKS